MLHIKVALLFSKEHDFTARYNISIVQQYESAKEFCIVGKEVVVNHETNLDSRKGIMLLRAVQFKLR